MLRTSSECQCREYCWIRTQAEICESWITGRGKGNHPAAEGLDDLGAPSSLEDAVLEYRICCPQTDEDGGSKGGWFFFTGRGYPVCRLGRHDRILLYTGTARLAGGHALEKNGEGRCISQTLETLAAECVRSLEYQMRLGVKSASSPLQVARQRAPTRTLLMEEITGRLVLGN